MSDYPSKLAYRRKLYAANPTFRANELTRTAAHKRAGKGACIAEFDRRNGQCEECGYKGRMGHFDWAHIDRASKKRDKKGRPVCISQMYSHGVNSVTAELKKCRLLCKFCHADETADENNDTDSFHVTPNES